MPSSLQFLSGQEENEIISVTDSGSQEETMQQQFLEGLQLQETRVYHLIPKHHWQLYGHSEVSLKDVMEEGHVLLDKTETELKVNLKMTGYKNYVEKDATLDKQADVFIIKRDI